MSKAAENIEEVDVIQPEDTDIVIDKKPDDEQKPTSPKHISYEDWVASGKNPDDWRSPREFRERGELIEQKKALERNFENQIKNLNALHQIRLQNEREELMKRRDDAIDIADKAEVKRIDKQLSDNEKQAELVKAAPQSEPSKAPEVIEFMEENPWSKDANDPRTIYANSVINEAMDNGRTLAYALRAAEKAVSAKFTEPQKKTSTMVEPSRTAGGTKQGGGQLTWSQLTPEEQKCYIPSMWKSEADFLKAVANDRKGSK